MDIYKQQLIKNIGIGGIKCFCCNKLARKHGQRKKDHSLQRTARRRLKQLLKGVNDGKG